MNTSLQTLRWQWLALGEMGPEQVYALLQLRARVFVVEQNCPYLDADGKDLKPGVEHLLAWDEQTLVACLRLIPPGGSFAERSLGRIVTAPEWRGSGLGHALMQRGMAKCHAQWPGEPLRIGAQAHLEKFYAQHGFEVASEPYLEDDIPHIEMLCRVSPPTS
ncbi:GNAT family N-acetyltransferase [Pseudomarimonas arenosa]|uniref:GNAT family N-acetyltransferase n=1 Tax=Pseudomarimonas arenosa TaxID=2774145 RepID=A0AAW3ZJQ4_9GAMM|nr:GNAT family N-acetyltransferase [Pseudomarimonas arenosa]MBD8525160.1 GNAT family N-acetyltransferase [Pseudomarimonas arenosa]